MLNRNNAHRLHHGNYPESLDDPTCTGAWFALHRRFVRYCRTGDGDERGLDEDAADQLAYPQRFFSGLGLVQTHVGREAQSL
jgi:hypothetical protein